MKNQLRQEFNTKRENLNFLEVQGISHQITQYVINFDKYKNAKTIMIYLPIKNEVRTAAIISTSWQLGKKICIPVCQTDSTNLVASELKDWNEVSKSNMGIFEPTESTLRPVDVNEIDLVFVPGLVFDKHGNRLGFGVGYFDRFLSTLPQNVTKVALAYNLQLVENITPEEHDIPMDYIITEEGIIKCNK